MDDLMAASTLVDQLSMAIPTNSNRSRLPPTAASTATATVPQQHDAERDNDSQPNRNQRQPSRRRRQDEPTTTTTTTTTNKDPLLNDNDKEDTKETDTNNHGPTRTTQNKKTSTRAVEENGEEDRDDDDDEEYKDDNESNNDDDEEEANHKASVMVPPSRTLADTGVFATFGSPSGPNETNHNHNNTTTTNNKRGPYKRNALIYAEFLDMGRRCGNTYVYCRHCYQVYLDHSQSNNSTTNANDKPTPYICRKRPETCRTHLAACPNYQRYRHQHGIREVVPGPAVPIPPPSLPVAAISTTTPTGTRSRKRPLPELPSITTTTTKRHSKPSRAAATMVANPSTIGQSVPERLAAVEAWLGAAPTPTTTSTRRTSTTPTITILQRIKYLEANYGLEGTGLKIAQRLEQLENL